MSTSIQGNDGFSQVRSNSSHQSRITVDNASLNNLSVNALTITDTVINSHPGVRNVVVGYTPTNFSTLAANAAVSLLVEPGRAQALDVNDADLIHIPANAIVERVVVTAPTTVVGGTTFNIGTSAVASGVQSSTVGKIGSSGGSSVALLVNTMLLATANAGGCVGGAKAVTELALNTAGQALSVSNLAGAVQGFTDNLVFLSPAAAVTAGALRVEITYVNA